MKVSDIRRKLFAALVAGGTLSPAAVHAANLNTNLVVNPDFEMVNLGVPGVNNGVGLVNWNAGTTTGFAYNYGQAYDLGGPLAGGGTYYFTSNQSGGTGTDVTIPGAVMQSIDVSAGDTSTAIASGSAGFNLSAFFTSYMTNGDIGNVHLRFVNSSNASLGTFLLSDPNPTGGWKQASGTSGIPIGTARVQVSLYGTGISGGPDGYIDNIDFQVVATQPALSITVNRTTGAITLNNQTGSGKNISSYSITSAFEGLAPANWQSIADNFDSGNPGPNQVDPTHPWTELTVPAAHGDLSEGDLATGDGASLANGRMVPIGLAGAWIRTFREDLVFSYVSNGAVVEGLVNYVAGSAAIEGDLNFDGALSSADWGIVRSNQNVNLSGLSLAEAYRQGDFTSDRKNDHADFVAFKQLYDAANGVGAFTAMVASVPEASGAVLVLTAGVLLAPLHRRIRRRELVGRE
jgi:hypothetical protein